MYTEKCIKVIIEYNRLKSEQFVIYCPQFKKLNIKIEIKNWM